MPILYAIPSLVHNFLSNLQVCSFVLNLKTSGKKPYMLFIVKLVHSSQPYNADDRTIFRDSFMWVIVLKFL